GLTPSPDRENPEKIGGGDQYKGVPPHRTAGHQGKAARPPANEKTQGAMSGLIPPRICRRVFTIGPAAPNTSTAPPDVCKADSYPPETPVIAGEVPAAIGSVND